MASAREMINVGGEIHFTSKTIYPFNMSDIKSLAGENGMRLIQPMQFKKWIFPGYSTKCESNCDSHFPFRFVVISMLKK